MSLVPIAIAPLLQAAARLAQACACALLLTGGALAQERLPQPLDDGAQLFEMGTIADASGRGARWWIESAGPDASPCRPRTLHVLVDVHMPLAREGVAREWMQLVHQRWVKACAADRRSAAPMMVRIQIHQGFELAPDASGHMPRGLVNALAAFQSGSLSFQQYQNGAIQAMASAGEAGGQESEYQANAQRLRQLAQRYQAGRLMDVQGLDRLRSRPVEKVLLVAVQPGALVGRNKREVHGARHEGWDASSAVVEGAEVAKWNNDSRMVAVRVKARSTDVRTPDRWVLTLLGSQACSFRDCEDFLLMPGGQWITQRELR